MFIFFVFTGCGNQNNANSTGKQESIGEIDKEDVAEIEKETNISERIVEYIQNPDFSEEKIGKTYIDGDYEYTVLEDGTVCISSYTGSESDLDIPTVLGGYSVSKIGERAFEDAKMVSLNVPGQIVEIGERAFQSCDNLSKIVLNEGTTTLLLGVFNSNEAVTEITLPKSLYRVDMGALPNDSNYSKNYYINGLHYVDNVVVGFDSNSFINAGTYSLENLEFAEGTTVIAETALWGEGIKIKDKEVRIPDTVKGIGSAAFAAQPYIEKFYLPSSVIYIGKGAISKNAKIYAEEGTVAEKYANENGIECVIIN